jgi:hypothetical protein
MTAVAAFGIKEDKHIKEFLVGMAISAAVCLGGWQLFLLVWH